ncbi:MAG: sulfatase-like hydrolase/transferase [Planctomycetes bacterium]|nr:sulfatase-like hydrolase/transferase [Planctomycetota bacterium]
MRARSIPLPLALALAAALPAADRPNIVFVYTDDQARWGAAAYGNPDVRTPSLDRLAREGALFLNAFTLTPVCSPSRATCFTGRYPSELGIEDWIDPKTEPEVGLSPDAVTWPKLLRAAGYRTGLIGKWHLGTAPRFHPARNGFDRFTGFLGGGAAPMDPTLEVDGKERRLAGAASEVLADAAISFLKEVRADPRAAVRPFLLCLHFRAPHAPYAPVPGEDSRPYEGIEIAVPKVDGLPAERVKRLTREYYASVTCMDRNLGRVLSALDELGLASSTLVLFSSDNGYMIGHHGLHHKGNAAWIVEGKQGPRPNCFEEAIRVPLLARWPGVVKPGTRVEAVVSNLDIFPSVLDAARVPAPADYRDRGRSLLPLLRGERSAAWDEALLGQYDMHHYVRAPMRMLRTPRWKLVRHLGPGGMDELYDLERDPGELSNLAAAPEAQEALVRLRAELDRRRRAVGDVAR